MSAEKTLTHEAAARLRKEILGRTVLLLGYGREGQGTHRLLATLFPDLEFVIADSKELHEPPVSGNVRAIFHGADYLKSLTQADTIVRTPGIPSQRCGQSGAHVTSATNLFFCACAGTIIGVTGTKGKSTTSALIAALLGESFADVRYGGNIGVPMLDLLEGSDEQTHFVLELSSYQLEDLRMSPQTAVSLNVVPEHLDYHSSFQAYCEAKFQITRHQRESDLFLYNGDFSIPCEFAARTSARSLSYGTDERAQYRLDSDLVHLPGGSKISIADARLRGPANKLNMCAALAAASQYVKDLDLLEERANTFLPLEHRLEVVGMFGGIEFINDSLSTVPEALVNALLSFPGRIETVIAGGYDRGLNYSAVGPALIAAGVRDLILFPGTADKIQRALDGLTGKPNVCHVESMENAVREAYKRTSPGKVCLLSPASTSFNTFRDYRDRGEQFKKWVKELAQGGPKKQSVPCKN